MKCKGAIDKNLSEFRSRRRLCVQMQWLRIMSHRREEKIVCFGDGATDGMGDGVANSPLVEISAAHDAASRTTRARSIPSVTCAPSDRKSVVSGTSVSVRVDVGGSRII